MKIQIEEKELRDILKMEFRRLYFLSNLDEETFSKQITETLKNYSKQKENSQWTRTQPKQTQVRI